MPELSRVDRYKRLRYEKNSGNSKRQADGPESSPSGQYGNRSHSNGDLKHGYAARQDVMRVEVML